MSIRTHRPSYQAAVAPNELSAPRSAPTTAPAWRWFLGLARTSAAGPMPAPCSPVPGSGDCRWAPAGTSPATAHGRLLPGRRGSAMDCPNDARDQCSICACVGTPSCWRGSRVARITTSARSTIVWGRREAPSARTARVSDQGGRRYRRNGRGVDGSGTGRWPCRRSSRAGHPRLLRRPIGRLTAGLAGVR
jgi:hypothetical protein